MTTPFPQHIAFIMDGNGRWAKARGLPRLEGHRRGVAALQRTIESCAEAGVRYATFYAFSSENWQRPAAEVQGLMGLLRHYLQHEIQTLHKNGVKLRFAGDRSETGGLSADIRRKMAEAEELTAENTGLTVTICLNYGGRDELVRAARQLAEQAAAGRLDASVINEEMLSQQLDTALLPDPDLCVRTSGELRLSNFMPWQLAYAELYFTPCFWPDFDAAELTRAIAAFQQRQRRFGGAEEEAVVSVVGASS